jgi:hypothetical protein
MPADGNRGKPFGTIDAKYAPVSLMLDNNRRGFIARRLSVRGACGGEREAGQERREATHHPGTH